MKEFNLALAKQGHPVCTRDGKRARIICFDRNCENYPIVALIESSNGIEDFNCYTKDGKYDEHGSFNNFDLVMVPQNKEGWVNVYKVPNYNSYFVSTTIYKTYSDAVSSATPSLIADSTYITTVRITWKDN